MSSLALDTFPFLLELKQNNQRGWFQEQKSRFQQIKMENNAFFQSVGELMEEVDKIEQVKPFRIYRDVRFSKDKSPYKTHFSCRFFRQGRSNRGTYYLHLEPNNSFCAGGFYGPSKEDLYRIRKEFEIDSAEIQSILSEKEVLDLFPNGIEGEELKTAPRGFDKHHVSIRFIRKKQFYLKKSFLDEQVNSSQFSELIVQAFSGMLPFLSYMSEIVTTDLNGESIL